MVLWCVYRSIDSECWYVLYRLFVCLDWRWLVVVKESKDSWRLGKQSGRRLKAFIPCVLSNCIFLRPSLLGRHVRTELKDMSVLSFVLPLYPSETPSIHERVQTLTCTSCLALRHLHLKDLKSSTVLLDPLVSILRLVSGSVSLSLMCYLREISPSN